MQIPRPKRDLVDRELKVLIDQAKGSTQQPAPHIISCEEIMRVICKAKLDYYVGVIERHKTLFAKYDLQTTSKLGALHSYHYLISEYKELLFFLIQIFQNNNDVSKYYNEIERLNREFTYNVTDRTSNCFRNIVASWTNSNGEVCCDDTYTYLAQDKVKTVFTFVMELLSNLFLEIGYSDVAIPTYVEREYKETSESPCISVSVTKDGTRL